jgi:hypothetical protein
MYHEDGSNKLLRIVGIYLPLDKVQCPVSLGFQNYKIFGKIECLTLIRIHPDISQVPSNGNFYFWYRSLSVKFRQNLSTLHASAAPQAYHAENELLSRTQATPAAMRAKLFIEKQIIIHGTQI